jgi:hypothetical protein
MCWRVFWAPQRVEVVKNTDVSEELAFSFFMVVVMEK